MYRIRVTFKKYYKLNDSIIVIRNNDWKKKVNINRIIFIDQRFSIGDTRILSGVPEKTMIIVEKLNIFQMIFLFVNLMKIIHE